MSQKVWLTLFWVTLFCSVQSQGQRPEVEDSLARIKKDVSTQTISSNSHEDDKLLLLLNTAVQIESNDAIDAMYNFKFKIAEYQFQKLKDRYGWHPLPYFLLGLNEWWQLVPYVGNTYHDDAFYAYMDTSLFLAERIYKEVNKIEGAFFLAATYAFKGRLLADRGHWRKAAFASKSSLKYLEDCKGNKEFSPEILFGDALFNYYVEWVPENYPMLRPFMIMFPDGDKELGLEQLKEVTNTAFYTRTEAKYFLMRILSNEEKDAFGAMKLAKELHQDYPDNAYFHRYYARTLYALGRYIELEDVSLEIIRRIEEGMSGYEENSGRYASFFLGQIYENRNKFSDAKEYYLLSLAFGDMLNYQEKGYYLYSLFSLAKIAERDRDYKQALEYYELLKKYATRKHRTYSIAKEKVKRLRRRLRKEL